MSKLRVALLGYGEWGANIAKTVLTLEKAELGMVIDSSPARRQAAQQQISAVRVESNLNAWKESDIEAVMICTPAATHVELVDKALLAGKHVFVEKPAALSLEDAQHIVRRAEERKKTLMAGHTFLFHASVRELKRLVDTHSLGKVTLALSRRSNLGRVRQDVDVWWNLAPHDVSILTYLFGRPATVSLTGEYLLGTPRADSVAAVLTWANGLIAHIEVSWISPGKERRLSLVGEKCSYVFDDSLPAGLLHFDKGREQLARDGREPSSFTATTETILPVLPQEKPLNRELQHFIDCSLTGEAPVSGGAHLTEVTEVLEAGAASLASERTVHLGKTRTLKSA